MMASFFRAGKPENSEYIVLPSVALTQFSTLLRAKQQNEIVILLNENDVNELCAWLEKCAEITFNHEEKLKQLVKAGKKNEQA